MPLWRTMKVVRTHEDFVLDAHEKYILTALSKDIRYSRKRLSSRLKISEQLVGYKIKKLIEQQVIYPSLILDFKSFNLDIWIILATHLTSKEIKAVEEHSTTYLAEELLGEYHYLCVHVSSQLSPFIKELYSESDIKIIPINRQHSDEFNGYNIKDFSKEYAAQEETEQQAIDKYEKILIQKLAETPDASFSELSKRTGISRSIIAKRYYSLFEKNIILKNRYACDIYKMGFEAYILIIHILPKDYAKITYTLINNRNSGHLYGNPNTLILNYICLNNTDLQHMISLLKNSFRVTISVFQNSGTYHINTFPKSILEKLTIKKKYPK